MTTWWWVRHGPTHAKAAIGWTDLPADLSDRGALARLDAHLPADAVSLSSPLSRARETLTALETPRNRLPHEPDIREMHFGAWEGRSFSDIAIEAPDLSRAFWESPGSVAPPGGESWDTLCQRVNRTVDRLNGSAEHVIAVAHFGVILAALARAGGLPGDVAFRFKVDPLSVTRLTWLGQDSWRIEGVNHKP